MFKKNFDEVAKETDLALIRELLKENGDVHKLAIWALQEYVDNTRKAAYIIRAAQSLKYRQCEYQSSMDDFAQITKTE